MHASRSVSNPGTTGRLHVTVLDEPALRAATSRLGTAQGLQIGIPDETALAAAIAVGGAAVGSSIAVLNEPTLGLAGLAFVASDTRAAVGGSIPLLNEPALCGIAVCLGSAPCLEISALDETALGRPAAVQCTAVSLPVRLLYEATLGTVGPCSRRQQPKAKHQQQSIDGHRQSPFKVWYHAT